MNNPNETQETKHLGDTEEVAGRWEKITKIFEAASALTGKEREKFLKKSCGDDSEMRNEVEKLLKSFEDSESFMQNPAVAEAVSMFEEKKTLIGKNTTGDIKNGNFVAGTVLANRYRIFGLIGKGGMGEVYKAEDLQLNQVVALKFLPEALARDEAALARFRGEVRTARQVAHVNVCRVFDIGEIDGRHFLSMEFIDGDDLSSLLRRIGRLPSDKALEISRQLCYGLHAIHQAGILHRDLKPANIIIDSKGKARITDFGIADLEEDIAKDNLRIGTPAYMSPEQITGKDVTAKSDLYSLGLLLYEIFTGKQAFQSDSVHELLQQQQTLAPTNPSEILRDINPLVEKTILQCLEKNPANRPKNALQVAMMLPGGNPLEAAIAAGETPSPEMVAASPKIGSLRPIVALALLLTALLGYGFMLANSKTTAAHHFIPLDKSPDVLRQRSRELVEKFGYRLIDSYHRFENSQSYVKYLMKNDQTLERWQKLTTGQPAVYSFEYRTSPQPIVPLTLEVPTWSDPPNIISGMTRTRIDTTGRLIFFEGVPPRVKEANQPRSEFDWAGVFKEAGFELANFQAVEPQLTPPQAFDEQRAFSGNYPDRPEIAIRVEAAVYQGKLVSFEIVEPWTPTPGQALVSSGNLGENVFIVLMFLGMLFGGGWLALRNYRAGRSDLKNAVRLALLLFAAQMIIWVFQTHHVASFDEFRLFTNALAFALIWVVLGCLFYLAFEPYLRKIAPERVISWNRLLAGDWRDPLVGRDVLIGIAGSSLIAIVAQIPRFYIPRWQGMNNVDVMPAKMLSGIEGFPVIFATSITNGLAASFAVSFFILLFGLILRRKWLGVAVFWSVFTTFNILAFVSSQDRDLVSLVASIIGFTIMVLIAARFGVVALMVFFLFSTFDDVPFNTDLSVWYSGNFILFVMILLGLSFYGFYTSIAGAKIFGGKSWLEE